MSPIFLLAIVLATAAGYSLWAHVATRPAPTVDKADVYAALRPMMNGAVLDEADPHLDRYADELATARKAGLICLAHPFVSDIKLTDRGERRMAEWFQHPTAAN